MLIIWCGADDKVLRGVIGKVLGSARVEHRVEKDITKFPATNHGDVVLSFGSKALGTLQALGLVQKGRTVTSTREKELKFNGASIICTFDPGIAQREYARLPEIQWDVQLACRLVKTGSTRPEIGTYRWVESFHDVIEAIESSYAATGKPVEVACDTETLGLVEYNPDAWIVSISFTYKEGFSDAMYFLRGEAPQAPPPFFDWDEMDYWQQVWTQVHWLLTTDKISLRGANWKYDSRWINFKWRIHCTNHKFDTLLVGSLLDENRSNSLKLHAKIYTPMGGYEDDMSQYDMGRMDLVPKDKLIDYMGGDTDATLRVANVMKKELLADKRLCNFYIKLVHPASHAFEKMERGGILVDLPYYHELKFELEQEISRLHKGMLEMVPHKLRAKYKDKIDKALEERKMPLTPAVLKDFLFSSMGLNLKAQVFTEKTKEPSTSMDHLMMFEDDPVAANFISMFRDHGSASKTYSTYVVGFLKHLRPDNRFHPTFLLAKMDYNGDEESGTDTGRTSAKDPAVQCVPRWVKVLTTDGYRAIIDIVGGYERGERYEVVTHDGSWRDVVGVYRNGVQPLFKVTLASGHSITCTGNHPLLTSSGFVRADNLVLGDDCYVFGGSEDWKVESGVEGSGGEACSVFVPVRVRNADGCTGVEPVLGASEVLRVLEGGFQQDARAHDAYDSEQNLHLLEEHPEAVLLGESQLVQELRGLGHSGSRAVAHIRELPCGHGRDACRAFDRTQGQQERLRAGELSLDSAQQAESQQTEYGAADIQRQDARVGGLGRGNRTSSIGADLESKERVEYGSGAHHAEEAVRAGYLTSAITCIERVEPEETFDLTIEGSHSFVANGVVVHNTIPKHTKWTKKLRRAYIPPPGYNIIQLDYSQGELRIAAVVAEEPTMIQAYRDGMDLHAITAAALNGYDLEEFFALPEDIRDELRSGGKAGNFGLIYGMQAPGFKEYAYTSYGVKMTEEEAFLKREAFFGRYSSLLKWHEEYRNHAKRWGFVRSPLGRVRHLPLINSSDREMRSKSERQAVNSPIQSCLSDMMQLAMVHIDREYGDCDIHTFLMTHDSLSLYVPEGEEVEWAKRLKSIMENLPLERDFGWSSCLKFIADAEMAVAGDDGVVSMATLKKLKGI